MVRAKTTPTSTDAEPSGNSLTAPAPVAPQPVRLRLRGPAGIITLDLQTTTTLQALVAACAAEMKAPVTHVSFRSADGRPVSLLSESTYPAGGALLIGPASTLPGVGLATGDTLNVQVQAKKKAPAKTKKKRARDEEEEEEDVWVPSDGDDDDAKARRLLGPARARAALDGGARSGDDASTVAAAFVNCHEAPQGLSGAAAGMWTSQQAAQRVEAARAGRVRVRATPATLEVHWRATARTKKETEERVRKFSADESVAVVCAILHRQAGSTRRKLSGDRPSTRLLTPEGVATRCPALFWSLYASSRTDPADEASPGDVAFALEHVVAQAMAAFEADVAALRGAS
jgi:hypothetical protein